MFQKKIQSLLFPIFFSFFILSSFTNLEKPIEQKIDQIASSENFNGTIALQENDHIIFFKSYGYADHENRIKNTNDSLYRIASISKQFTAVSILQLYEKGLINLDDKIIKYLPDYPINVGNNVTIHQLLTNTSGIPEYTKIPAPLNILLNGLTADELISIFKDKPLEFEPGTKYSYSSSNYIILGVIIEKVSELSYPEYLQKNIFDVIPLTHTFYRRENYLPLEVLGYTLDSNNNLTKATNLHNSLAFSTGGIVSTAGDLLIWNQALHQNKVLSKKSFDLMRDSHVFRDDSQKKFYGYGYDIDLTNQGRCILHHGTMMGFKTLLADYPEKAISLVILSNHDFSKELILKIQNKLVE